MFRSNNNKTGQDLFVHGCTLTLAGDAVLTWREQHQQRELGADEALAGARHARHGQVSHGVGRSVYSSETAAAGACATRDGLKPEHTHTHTSVHSLIPHLVSATINALIHTCVFLRSS